jgi:hypothetical protein
LAALVGLFVPEGWVGVPGTLFGLPGLVVFLVSFWVEERFWHKLVFCLGGGAAGALLITLVVFHVLSLLGRTPGGDGGGITVPMILLCPPLFIIGSVGGIVVLIRSKHRSSCRS